EPERRTPASATRALAQAVFHAEDACPHCSPRTGLPTRPTKIASSEYSGREGKRGASPRSGRPDAHLPHCREAVQAATAASLPERLSLRGRLGCGHAP